MGVGFCFGLFADFMKVQRMDIDQCVSFAATPYDDDGRYGKAKELWMGHFAGALLYKIPISFHETIHKLFNLPTATRYLPPSIFFERI